MDLLFDDYDFLMENISIDMSMEMSGPYVYGKAKAASKKATEWRNASRRFSAKANDHRRETISNDTPDKNGYTKNQYGAMARAAAMMDDKKNKQYHKFLSYSRARRNGENPF